MAAKLRVIPPASTGAAPFEVPIGNTATLGRTADNTVCLSFSPTVSRQHAVIRCHNGYEYQLMDLGSRNGTFVNDQRVVMPVVLRDGARIRIANSEIVFMAVEDEGAGDSADVTVAGSMTGSTHGHTPRCAAILVCDIRGFSTQSEILPADQVAMLLGQWFRDAGNAVQKSGGIIDKFIGDAVLAYWPENPGPPRECVTAFETARRMLALAGKMAWPTSGKPFRVGIALHYGRVTYGNIGLVAARDATIIGNAVNTAFRLEGVMKELGQELLLSERLVENLPDRAGFSDLGKRNLKGLSEPVGVFGWKPA